MRRISIFIYISIASLLLLLLISLTPTKRPTNRHPHRRLRLRSNVTFSPPLHRQQHDHYIPFDPVIADIELRREDNEWEKQYTEHWNPNLGGGGESAAAAESQPEWEEFINDEGRFNVTERLIHLFPKIDVDPPDGFVSAAELSQWNMQQVLKENMHRTEREFQIQDKNHDGFVSFAEYEPPSWALNAGNGSFGYGIDWWKEEHFYAADADGDGLLDINEFNDFLNPADSKNPKLLRWLCADELSERDTDKDGKLNFSEFFHGIFGLARTDDEDFSSSYQDDDSMEAPARNMFSELDKDNDGYLSVTELLPLIGKIHPSEAFYAQQQAESILSQVDDDDDGRLTLADMIENPDVFYNSGFSEDEYEYPMDYPYHDEFR